MIWNCIDCSPCSFNRGGSGERKDGNKVNTWTPYRERNNKKNNFLVPAEVETDLKNI